jgi:hypothetical protein
MNSSTSSFRTELKVLLVVAVLIGTLEICVRMQFARFGDDAALLRNFPALADKLASQPGTSMLLLGNSLTQTGYDLPLLNKCLQDQGDGDLHVESIALSGSNPIEWYHNFARNFVQRGKPPNVIVIGMSPSGIYDDLPAGYRIGWLANETAWQDVPEVLFDDLHNFEVGGQYLMARVSMLYAIRWDLRVGLVSSMVPHTQEGMEWVNSGQPKPKVQPGALPPPKTYSLLTRLLELARANHVHVILVAMPARESYEIEPGMPPLLKAYDVTFLDCRAVPGLTTQDFKDGWHLTPEGARIFTPYMAKLLPATAKAFGPPPPAR